MTGKSGTGRFPAPGNSPEPGDLHYLHPLVPRPGSSLSCARALHGPTVHSCGSACAAASFLPILPAPGRRAGARSRRELSGNPPRGGWPGALTSS